MPYSRAGQQRFPVAFPCIFRALTMNAADQSTHFHTHTSY
jgi:hypothetical protein